ncbi:MULTISPECIES: MlaA family lipoprotein [Vibrio]|uniref:MlaA family lipoprotein n=1 Tax=Vibrio aestuarianus TaxID=28171 RepID=A0A9X4INK8_9VIBR|nr:MULTISPECIES: MlaA family lipoprotein [Vibrio]MDE1240942.1 MlaA family lipoprotein [Vibrio aestuarianus]MDE1263921.1 MlaA family lipoprotein [Vibrio aestuarianus]MDE1295849.1 MlaA family lipoprotein [Vibrio aestuarianus]MDE1329104.1 MlaA family lipoprotein [Vibrio aestuarianus]MDE1334422.1 MlaA family lipoprotein [Vibrio aestuarianus]
MISRIGRATYLTLLFFLLVGCTSAPDSNSPQLSESSLEDPFESFNRSMWTINYDYLDPYIVRPISIAYVGYIPVPIRNVIANVLSNLDEPSSVINNLLMGNGEKAVDHLNRFWLNSTLGLLGMIDIASEAGITKHNEKAFSDAVGHYGVGNGPYVMIPAYGPYTIREVTDVVDGMYVPLSYLNIWASLGKWAFEGMEKRALLVSQESTLENSPDPYSLTRDVYLQRQDFKAEIDNQPFDESEEDYLDDYLEEGF